MFAVRGEGVYSMRTRWGRGFFRCRRSRFLMQKIGIFRNLWCVCTDKGVEPVRIFFGQGGGVDFLWTSFMDSPLLISLFFFNSKLNGRKLGLPLYARDDQQPEQEWSRIRSLAFFDGSYLYIIDITMIKSGVDTVDYNVMCNDNGRIRCGNGVTNSSKGRIRNRTRSSIS